jgi:hypothetical protein
MPLQLTKRAGTVRPFFRNPSLERQARGVLGRAAYGSAEVGEVLATFARISDEQSWAAEFARTAQRTQDRAVRGARGRASGHGVGGVPAGGHLLGVRRRQPSSACPRRSARTKNSADGETLPLSYVDSRGCEVPHAAANAVRVRWLQVSARRSSSATARAPVWICCPLTTEQSRLGYHSSHGRLERGFIPRSPRPSRSPRNASSQSST